MRERAAVKTEVCCLLFAIAGRGKTPTISHSKNIGGPIAHNRDGAFSVLGELFSLARALFHSASSKSAPFSRKHSAQAVVVSGGSWWHGGKLGRKNLFPLLRLARVGKTASRCWWSRSACAAVGWSALGDKTSSGSFQSVS